MTNSIPARADRRALFGAAALGSCLGLALGGAYLAGGLARSADAAAEAAQSVQVASVEASDDGSDAPALRGSLDVNPMRGRLVPAVAPFSLRGRAAASRDLECLSQAVYYEARGEAEAGQAAVAQVVLNRVRHPRFPKSICAVVFQGCQFSFTCDGSVSRRVEGAAWRRAERVAKRALAGFVMADVGAATDFRVSHIAPTAGLMRVAQIGSHAFYRFGGRLGQASALSGRPERSEEPRRVLASFSPAAAEQVLAAGLKVVERTAAAMGGGVAHAATPAPAPAPAATPPAPVESTGTVKVAPAMVATTTPKAAPALSPAKVEATGAAPAPASAPPLAKAEAPAAKPAKAAAPAV